jgi:hypothetical protein
LPYPEVVKAWGLAAALLLVLAGYFWWRQDTGMTLREQVMHLPTSDGIFVVAEGAVVRKIAGEAGGEEAEYRDFVTRTGFDYRRDLDRLVALIGEPHSYYVAVGRFDWPRIAAYAGNCVKNVCSLPASQPGKWISLMPLGTRALAVAVSPNQLAVGQMEKRREPLLEFTQAPFLVKGKAKHFARWGLAGEDLVEIRLAGDELELKTGGATRRLPVAKIFE